jgi:hypothetical protein
MSNQQAIKTPQREYTKNSLYIRFAKRADLAVATGDHDLAILLVEGAFLALEEMVLAEHNSPQCAVLTNC